MSLNAPRKPRRKRTARTLTVKALLIGALIWAGAWAALSTDGLATAQGTEDGRDIVVVLHGLGRSKASMWMIASRLEDAGYQVARIGYRSLKKTPDEILADIGDKIAECCIGKSPRLHFVGHSLGGLLIRAYLSDTAVANLGRVVLIGTPNTGTEIVDNLRHKWWFRVLGPTAERLGTGADSFPNTIGPPTYPVGVIAGKRTGLPNDDLLPGEDDGLVSVESTKIEGMTDFIVIETGHAAMRYDRDVARHALTFLQSGRFDKR